MGWLSPAAPARALGDSPQTLQSDEDETPAVPERMLTSTIRFTYGGQQTSTLHLCEDSLGGKKALASPVPSPKSSPRSGRSRSLDEDCRPLHKSPVATLDELPSRSTDELDGLTGIANEFRVDDRDLKLREVIGAGAFGTVRAATWRSTPVAVKILFHDSTVEDWDLFKKEIRLMSRLHHPNIAQFLGWSHIPELALVVELFEHGSLEAYVPRQKPGIKTTLAFCRDMARAVEYLHGRRPQIVVHRDLKPPNFLVSKCLRIKLGDFGIARGIGRPAGGSADGSTARGPARECFGEADEGDRVSECELTTECGTARFMAPEVASPDGGRGTKARYDHAADIFSLALCYYFVWERKLPNISGVGSVEEHRRAIESGARPSFSRTPGVVRNLIRSMWALDPRDRASATEVCERLDRCKVRSQLCAGAVVLGK